MYESYLTNHQDQALKGSRLVLFTRQSVEVCCALLEVATLAPWLHIQNNKATR